jgi:uncharacterized protein (DUF433 family)
MSEFFTLAEASAISELSPETIRTILEKNKFPLSRRRRVGKAIRHEFSFQDLFLLKLLVDFPFPLSHRHKTALQDLVIHGGRPSGCWREEDADLIFYSGDITVIAQCKNVKDRLSRNLESFAHGKRCIVSDPAILSGTPVFRGTRIPLDHIAGLFRKGVDEREIIEDFPRLSRSDLEFAKLYSRIGARPGRPRKRIQIRKQYKVA